MTAAASGRRRLADHASLALCVGALLGSALLYRRLPAELPIHFDLHGRVDGTAPRLVGAFLMPIAALGVWTFARELPGLLSGQARARALASPLPLVTLLVIALVTGLHGVMLETALARRDAAGPGLGLVLALFSIALGLVMPKLRRNGFAGIRTPTTLASDENWQRTHRVGGALFALAGVVGLVAVPFGATAVTLGALVGATLASVVYSYVLARGPSR